MKYAIGDIIKVDMSLEILYFEILDVIEDPINPVYVLKELNTRKSYKLSEASFRNNGVKISKEEYLVSAVLDK